MHKEFNQSDRCTLILQIWKLKWNEVERERAREDSQQKKNNCNNVNLFDIRQKCKRNQNNACKINHFLKFISTTIHRLFIVYRAGAVCIAVHNKYNAFTIYWWRVENWISTHSLDYKWIPVGYWTKKRKLITHF